MLKKEGGLAFQAFVLYSLLKADNTLSYIIEGHSIMNIFLKSLVWVSVFFVMIPVQRSFANAPDSFADLAERLLPTVVNVSTTQAVPELKQENVPQFPPGSPFEDFFKEFFEHHQNAPNQAPENRPSSLGSGFVIDAENGYIVTNNHVISGAEEIKIILHDDSTLDAELVGTDEKTDLAVLKVKTDKPLVAATWGDSDQAPVGSWVVAIGNPFGLGGTVTAGIVSARQRDINAGPYDDFIQTDASINRGNSGGPMFNTNGEVIGVNTAIFSPSGGSVGIGFAVPSTLAKGVVEQLIKYGKTRRGWLGVRIQVVTDEIAESLGLKKASGALVASVTPDGPAEKSGLKAGDIILSFNGQKIESMRNLPRIVAETDVGKKSNVTIWRDKTEKTLKVELGELEKAEEDGLLATASPSKAQKSGKTKAHKIDAIGLSVAKVTPDLAETYGLDEGEQGLVITKVESDGSAAKKGLSKGEVIVEIDQTPITEPKDVKARIKAAEEEDRKSILLLVKNGSDLRFVALKISE